MSQHDYDIANGSGAAFRADLNLCLAAGVGLNSGAAAPSTTFAYMWWADTTTGLLKQRNAANNVWITKGTLANAEGVFTGGISTNAVPSSAWGIDEAQANQLVTIANNGTYDLAAGSGLVIIQDNGTAQYGMFMCWGGSTTLISDPAVVFSVTSGTASKTNFYYNGSTAYRIQNKTGASASYYITTIKTRAST